MCNALADRDHGKALMVCNDHGVLQMAPVREKLSNTLPR